jgi:hypothetical protein
VDTIEDLFRRFEQLNEIGAALSHERDIDKLLETSSSRPRPSPMPTAARSIA